MAPKRSREGAAASSGGGGPGDNSSNASSPPPSEPGSSPPPADEPGSSPEPELPADDVLPSAGGYDMEEEDDGEDLFGDEMANDYRPMGAMDEYEDEGLDHHDYDDTDYGARAAAEAALADRDQRERASRMPAALMTSDDDGDERPQRRRRQERGPAVDGQEQDPAAFVEELLDEEEVSDRVCPSSPPPTAQIGGCCEVCTFGSRRRRQHRSGHAATYAPSPLTLLRYSTLHLCPMSLPGLNILTFDAEWDQFGRLQRAASRMDQ